jgi:hypothetical protein
MKITFNFDRDRRAFHLEPEDSLEVAVMKEMESATAKGQTITLRSIKHPETNDESFLVEMRVNGHQARVTQSKEDVAEKYR